jgi:cytidylate kinase
MAVITISRQFGAGGMTLAGKLAEVLGYEVANEEVIEMLTEMASVSEESIRTFEGEEAFLTNLTNEPTPAKNVFERIFNTNRKYMDGQQYVNLLNRIVPQIAEKGNTIIVGRGAQFILTEHKYALHILLVADEDHRVKFLRDKYQLTTVEAEQAMARQHKRRKKLMRLFHNEDFDQPQHYDLVINMTRVPLAKAAMLIRILSREKDAKKK